jgi:hypothetical protein
MDEELRESVIELCQAMKLLAIITKSAGYAALAGDEEKVEKMSRDVEQVSTIADKALQRMVRDTKSLAGYPHARTGDLGG